MGAPGALYRQVGRAADVGEIHNLPLKPFLIPDVISERQRVHPTLGQGAGDASGQTGAGGRVLRVRDDEIERPLLPERRYPRQHEVATGSSDNITDEQESNHASKSARAGLR